MDHIKKIYKENKGKLWFSFFLNALFLIGLLIAFRPVYETNDDIGLANMVNGVKGATDAHLFHIHYFLGVLLEKLYQIKQTIPWFAVLQYLFLYLSFVSITYVLIRKSKSISTTWISYILVFWFAYEGYIKIQFTKTAGIVSVAGMLLLFYVVTCRQVVKGAFAAGILLSCIGFMYRDAQFFAEAVLMTGIGVYLILHLRDYEKRIRLKKIMLYFGTFGGLLVIVMILRFANQSFYKSPEWEEYKQYNDARAELFDHGFPSYDANEAAYNELGIDRNAYKLLRNWNHMDTEKFTTEVLYQIAELKQPKKIDKQFLKDFWNKIPLGIFKIQCFYCFLFVCAYWLLFGRHKRAEVLSVVYEAIIVSVIYVYLFYWDRYLLNRVDCGIWIAVSVFLLWISSESKAHFSERTGFFLFLTVFGIMQYGWKGSWRANSDDNIAEMMSSRAVIETISQDSDHLYLMTAGTVSLSESYGPFDSIPEGLTDNIYSVGGWVANTPMYLDIIHRYGIENPMKDFIGKENVYVMTRDIDTLMEYVKTYYAPDAKAEVVKEIGGINVYSIR